MYDFEDVLKFIDGHKCFKKFNDGDAFFINKWFFNEHNVINVNIPKHKTINSALNKYKCTIIEIDNYHINIILRTNDILDKFKHYAQIYLKIQKHYTVSQDVIGLGLINIIIKNYFDFISGHLLSHNHLVQKELIKTINNVQKELQKINPDIFIEDNYVIMYNCSEKCKIDVKNYFKGDWQQVHLNTWEYKNYDIIENKIKANN